MNEVYALRYAYRTESRRGEHFYGHVADCCGPYPIDYFMWAILGDDRTVVVDTGFTPETAAERGNRHHIGTPPELLRKLRCEPDEVTDLVITHLHYDHTGYADAFPNARIWLQRTEWDFWLSPLARRGAFAHLVEQTDLDRIRGALESGRVTLLNGDADIGDGITLHHVGGHTPGMQVMRVATSTKPVVLAADASHFYANVEGDHPYGIVYDLGDMYAAFDKLAELAGDEGIVVPGHDPRVVDRHTPVEGSDGTIFRLDR